MTKKKTRLENDGPPPNRNPKKIQRFPAKDVVQPTRIETTKKANRTGGCLRYRWIPHPTRRSRAVGPVLGMMKEARAKRSPDTLTLSTATAYATAYQTPRISSVIAPSAKMSRSVGSVDRGSSKQAPRMVIVDPLMSVAAEAAGSAKIAPEYFRPPSRSTFAHLSPVPHLIPRGLSDHRGKRGNDGSDERNVRGRRPELAGRLRLVRMLARLRCVRRRRLTLTTHPSHRSAERGASTTPPIPLFFRRRIDGVGRGLNPLRRLGRPTSSR